jgi:hypothetical protein
VFGPGSQQLRIFRRAIWSGATLEEACAATGNIINEAEGKIYLAADAKNPPGPECFELIPAALPDAANPKEMTMADNEENGGAYKRPDAAKAIEIYDKQIAPKLTQINTLKGDLSDPWGDLKEHARISKKDFGYVQGLFDEEDDAKRDHRLLSLSELLRARGLTIPRDLVTIAEGNAGGSVIPMGDRKRPQLATLPLNPSDGTETDLADAGQFEEASEEEIAVQAGRPTRAARKASVSSMASPESATAAVN